MANGAEAPLGGTRLSHCQLHASSVCATALPRPRRRHAVGYGVYDAAVVGVFGRVLLRMLVMTASKCGRGCAYLLLLSCQWQLRLTFV